MSKPSHWLSLVLLLWIAGCGDDAMDSSAGTGGTGAPSRDGGMAGSGGTGNSGGAGNSGGTGGPGRAGAGGSGRMNAQAGMGAGGQNGAGNGDASGAGGVGGDGSGMGGASGGPAFDAADHCGPGEYVPPLDFARASGPNHAQSCVAQDFLAAGEAGVFDTMPALRPGIWSVELAAPMTADEPYSFSIEIEFRGVEGAMRYELWGTNARCGAESTAIKLAELPLAVTKQVLCLDVTPAEAYSHMLIVTRDIDDVPPTDRQLVALNGAMFCADGSCP